MKQYMTNEEIVANWEGNLEYSDWYAVDSYNPNTMQMKRIAVVDSEQDAYDLVSRCVESSEFAMSPFYRCQLVPKADALRFFQGDESIQREDGFLTVTEAAERLGVTRARVHQLIQAGKLAAERVGSVWMVYEYSVNGRAAQ